MERFAFYLTGKVRNNTGLVNLSTLKIIRILGIRFIIRTDSEANEYIFGGQHRIGKRAVSRAETWALRLQPFVFGMDRVAGPDNIADALSRLIATTQKAVPFEENDETHFLYTIDSGSMEITVNEIESEAELDNTMLKLRKAMESDIWPRDLSKYEAQRKTLHALGTLVFKDNQIVLPESLRLKALQTAHAGHIGEVAMKRIMREYFWWPGMSTATENFAKRAASWQGKIPLCHSVLATCPKPRGTSYRSISSSFQDADRANSW